MSSVLSPSTYKKMYSEYQQSDRPTTMQACAAPAQENLEVCSELRANKIISFLPLLPPGIESFHLPVFPSLPTLPSNTKSHSQLHQKHLPT